MELDEQQEDLLRQVVKAHEQDPHPGLEGERLRLHAALHTVVETQIRTGSPPKTQQTLDRLVAEGLDRHEAIHAIAAVVSEQLFTIMTQKAQFDEAQYSDSLDGLSAKSWREQGA